MPKHSGAKLVSLEVRDEEQSVNTLTVFQLEPSERSKPELDIEIQCGRCDEIMELHSKFDKLVYSCESCSFLLKCV